MADLNEVLAELKTVFENGFTRSGVQQLGTSVGTGVLTVLDYKGNEIPFEIDTDYNATDNLPVGPGIYFHSISPASFFKVGSRNNVYSITAELVFNEQSKVVGGNTLCETKLARHFLHYVTKSINMLGKEMSTIRRVSLTDGRPQDGRVGNTNIYGCTIEFELEF